jgi:hypothetical protein
MIDYYATFYAAKRSQADPSAAKCVAQICTKCDIDIQATLKLTQAQPSAAKRRPSAAKRSQT